MVDPSMKNLAHAVIGLAVQDVLSPRAKPADRQDAFDFLTTPNEGIEFWAAVADLSPTVIRERILRLTDEVVDPTVPEAPFA